MSTTTTEEFTGWPAEGPALLAAIAADNTREFWAEHREEHLATVLGPMRALAAALEAEFGPVRVLRPQVNLRFRPDAPPYRTDTGGVAVTAGGCTLGVVLSATSLAVSAGHRSFDGGQLRRFRAAVDGTAVDGTAGEELGMVVPAGFSIDPTRALVRAPRGYPAEHARIGFLRRRGLHVVRAWEIGPWVRTVEPLRRVREAWRAAAPLVGWLDEHVGPADPGPPRPRPPAVTGPTRSALGRAPAAPTNGAAAPANSAATSADGSGG